MAKDFSISMPNAAEFRRRLEGKRQGVETEVKKEVEVSAKGVRTMLHAMTPRGVNFGSPGDSGRAEKAFTNSPKEAGDAIFEVDGYSAKVGSNVFYMKFLEYGTRAHGPVRAPFLVFRTLNGGWIRTKWVKGIRPMKIFARTREAWSRIFPGRIKAAVKKGLTK